MGGFAAALNYGIPFFVILILIEYIYGRIVGRDYSNHMDTISSLSSGITNTTKAVLGLSISIIGYSWLENKIGIFDLKPTWYVFVLAFIGKDFAGYWIHRMEHVVNIFWNRHIVHHSSEEFNLPCALRQSISDIFSYTAFFLLPIAILGVPGEVYGAIAAIHLFAQFWYHTRHIKRMGFLENIIVTPSHHRVHHAINPEYLDKNFSQIFIIWDKLFGTFQEEMDDVPCVYGVKKQSNTWNPIIINWQHFWQVIQDSWHAQNWKDKAKVWFARTGWRPADVAEKYPIEIIEDPYTQVKYAPKASGWLQAWSYVQLTTTMLLAIYLFNMLGPLSEINKSLLFVYGGFIFFSVFAYTSLMDRKWYALILEGIRSLFGIGVILYTGDWFLMNGWFAAGKFILVTYFAVSALVVTAFVLFDIRKDSLAEEPELQASAAA